MSEKLFKMYAWPVMQKNTRGTINKMRANGFIPAIIYGENKENKQVIISSRELDVYTNKHSYKNGVIILRHLDAKTELSHSVAEDASYSEERCYLRDVQLHPVRDWPMHVDFQRITANNPIAITSRVKVINNDISKGIKRGGLLNLIKRKVKIKCSPDCIPPYIQVDIKDANVGDMLYINDVQLENSVVVREPGNFPVLAITGKKGKIAAEETV